MAACYSCAMKTTVTGMDLKIQRVRRRLSQAQVAEQLGCSRQRITQLEASRLPPLKWVEKYKELRVAH